jgi:hypothetical protein
MLYREIIAVRSEISIKNIIALRGQNIEEYAAVKHGSR